ncbi:hypothetical protein [Amycolatopsis antarctica]|nr:hypothetical protein [Amycolatopsis antarctica]
MKKVATALVLAAALLGACDTHPAAPATPPAENAAAPSPPPAPPGETPPLTEHTVTIRVNGPPGAVFQVSGAVFGNTGPIAMPEAGTDSASFTTTTPGDMGLRVSVMPGPNPRSCAIDIDGTATVSETSAEDGTEVVCVSARTT